MAEGWSVWLWWIARSRAVLCWSFASRGRYSLSVTPGTLVAIGFHVPFTSAGASGLGSDESLFAGPPLAEHTITDFALPKLDPRPRPAPSAPPSPHRRIPGTLIPPFTNP